MDRPLNKEKRHDLRLNAKSKSSSKTQSQNEQLGTKQRETN